MQHQCADVLGEILTRNLYRPGNCALHDQTHFYLVIKQPHMRRANDVCVSRRQTGRGFAKKRVEWQLA